MIRDKPATPEFETNANPRSPARRGWRWRARRACVIGAGFGGLALAIRLQSAGVATTLVEARDKPGGRAYFWEREGFTFDAGPTVITDPDCLRELWALSGHDMADDIELMPVIAVLPPQLARRDQVRLFERRSLPCSREIAPDLARRSSPAMRNSCEYAAGGLAGRLCQAGPCAVPRFRLDGQGRAGADASYQAWRSVYSMVSQIYAVRKSCARRSASTPCWSAAIR